MPTAKFKIKNSDLVDYKRKKIARQVVAGMIKRKELVRASNCQLCKQTQQTEAHHLDYGQPAKVMWLCDACHGEVHRKDHPLNPANIHQTITPLVWNERDYATVGFSLPVENFIALKKLAAENNTTVSKLIRGCVLEKYPVDDNQLEFKFEGNINGISPRVPKRISLLEYTQKRLFEQAPQKVYSLWVPGANMAERVVRFSEIFRGYGQDSRQMRWIAVAR